MSGLKEAHLLEATPVEALLSRQNRLTGRQAELTGPPIGSTRGGKRVPEHAEAHVMGAIGEKVQLDGAHGSEVGRKYLGAGGKDARHVGRRRRGNGGSHRKEGSQNGGRRRRQNGSGGELQQPGRGSSRRRRRGSSDRG